MAEFRFPCPQCGQIIECDELWTGHQIECPSCRKELTVPAQTAEVAKSALVPKVPTSANPRLSLGHDQTRQPAVAGRNIPIRNLAPDKEKKPNPILQGLAYIIVLAAVVGGGYYGYRWYKQRSEAKATEAKAAPAEGSQEGAGDGGSADASKKPHKRPPAPVAWTLDLDAAKIPEAPANGAIAGGKFKPDTVRVDRVGAAQVLRLTQGALTAPDREVLVYLYLKAGESLNGQHLDITKDTKTAGIPQVIKRWKADSGTQVKTFPSGYALKLELEQATNGTLPGKIFVALPDPEQTVVAGTFQASVAAGGK